MMDESSKSHATPVTSRSHTFLLNAPASRAMRTRQDRKPNPGELSRYLC